MEKREPVVRLNFYDLLILLARWRKLFIVNLLLVVAAAVVIALLLPVWYSAATVILPSSGAAGGMPSFLPQELIGVATSFGLELPSEEIYQTILGSRTLKERIVERFDLRQVYGMDENVYLEDVLMAFGSHMTIVTREDRSIKVTVEDRDPELAAAMADACVEELDAIYSGITSETARKNRHFIERRLQQVGDTLAALQDRLQAFQHRTGAIQLTEQMVVMINTASELKAKQLAADVRFEVIRNSFGKDHPLVGQLSATSRELERKYNSLISGREGELFIGLQELPEVGRQYAELFWQIGIQTRLLEYIYPQYESARIQEQRETANVQVLDRALAPNRKSRPPRRMIVMIAAVVSLVATLIMVLIFEYWRSLPERSTEDWDKVQHIKRVLRGR